MLKCPTLTVHGGPQIYRGRPQIQNHPPNWHPKPKRRLRLVGPRYIQSGKLGKVVIVKCYNTLSGGSWKTNPTSPFPRVWTGTIGSVPHRTCPIL